MRITYDRKSDAAYIYLREIAPSDVVRTLVDVAGDWAIVNLDFDADNRLIGIEVLDASNTLPETLLAAAERGREQWAGSTIIVRAC